MSTFFEKVYFLFLYLDYHQIQISYSITAAPCIYATRYIHSTHIRASILINDNIESKLFLKNTTRYLDINSSKSS